MTDSNHPVDDAASGRPGPQPLPAGWLPEARPSADDGYWDSYAVRVLTELEPLLLARDSEALGRARSWVDLMGDRWGAAALLAAAAVAALLAVGVRERAAEPSPLGPDDIALALIASEGDPAVLWERLGIPVDPVLAWLTLDGARP